MEGYLNVFNNRLSDLIKLSITERKNNGNGALFLDFSNKEKLDAFYIPLIDKESGELHANFPSDLVDNFIEKTKTVPSSVIFFYLFDQKEKLFLELDLEKDSEYTNHQLKKQESSQN